MRTHFPNPLTRDEEGKGSAEESPKPEAELPSNVLMSVVVTGKDEVGLDRDGAPLRENEEEQQRRHQRPNVPLDEKPKMMFQRLESMENSMMLDSVGHVMRLSSMQNTNGKVDRGKFRATHGEGDLRAFLLKESHPDHEFYEQVYSTSFGRVDDADWKSMSSTEQKKRGKLLDTRKKLYKIQKTQIKMADKDFDRILRSCDPSIPVTEDAAFNEEQFTEACDSRGEEFISKLHYRLALRPLKQVSPDCRKAVKARLLELLRPFPTTKETLKETTLTALQLLEGRHPEEIEEIVDGGFIGRLSIPLEASERRKMSDFEVSGETHPMQTIVCAKDSHSISVTLPASQMISATRSTVTQNITLTKKTKSSPTSSLWRRQRRRRLRLSIFSGESLAHYVSYLDER
jgi:hypothetical protein